MGDRYRLTTPCTDCPFRTDKPFPLRRSPEIAQALREGSTFDCHKTTHETGTGKPAFCAGALIVLEKSEGPNQIMRIAERYEGYRPDALDMDAPVYGSLREFVTGTLRADGTDDEEEGTDYCGIANWGCDNPAGYAGGTGAVDNLDPPTCTDECSGCGVPVCEACSSTDPDDEGRRRCPDCVEEEPISDTATVGGASA